MVIDLSKNKPIDLNELLISNSLSTFFVQVTGDSMVDCGILNDDILVVDRSVTAKDGDVIIAALNGEFTVKELRFNPLALVPHNKTLKPIEITPTDSFELFGVVVGLVRKMKRKPRQF